MKNTVKLRALSTAMLLTTALSGCSTFSQTGGFDRVESLVQKQLGDDVVLLTPQQSDQPVIQAKIKQLLAKPIDIDQAVQVALLNNRQLQAQYANVGIAEADLVQAGRLTNPGFSYSNNVQAGQHEYERFVLFDLLGLLTMSQRTKIAEHQFERAKITAAKDTLSLAYRVKKAWIMAVASQQELVYYDQLQQAAEAGAELAKRMKAVGNLSLLAQDRQRVFYAEVVAQRERIKQQHIELTEALVRLLGVSSPDAIQLPDRLPAFPRQHRGVAPSLTTAMDQRLDLLMAREATDALAKSLGLTQATSWMNALSVGHLNTDSDQQPHKEGYSIEFRLPIFDWGDAKNAKAKSLYKQAINQTEHLVIQAQSEVRERYAVYLNQYRLVQHYRDEIIPLRQRISDENMLRYNGMLVGVFELLADARAQIASVNDYLNAQRDYWLSDAALNASIQGVDSSVNTISTVMMTTNADATDH